ncbi:MAG: mannose-1-phosphate guanylyltransferase [Vicingaceae bacterium]|tara:strand:+ start:348 stop:1427 length:1080 start_codon:yes stop_codon:yes gene_type:complete
MNKENNYCVIMAGGIGSRFWPMSRTAFPKQFIDILGTGQTLIQQTFDRLLKLVPKENIYIVTNDLYKNLVLEQLDVVEDQVLCEPSRRNTAPCIAYANYKIASKNPNANIIVAPADHLILKEDKFLEVMTTALNYTEANNALVTLGIKPSRPDTGYGYIQFEDSVDSELKRVKTFTEKPDLMLAKQFLDSGDFSWNSGMFIWSLSSISESFEKLLPEMDTLFKEQKDAFGTEKEALAVNSIYSECKSVSIDYGIMEKAKNVFVLSADIGWSDLGTWGSIYTHLDHDDDNNAIVGKNVMLYDSEDCIVSVPKNKLVVLQGLKDYIVVESNDTLLVCKKKDEQKIKQFVTDIKMEKGDKFV